MLIQTPIISFKLSLPLIPVEKNSKSILMSQQPFQKFINRKNNAAIKEKHKQAKKQAKKERAAAIEKHFEEKRAAKTRGFEKKQDEPINKRQKYPRKRIENADKSSFNSPAEKKKLSLSEMPLNKFIAHCGITSRRDAVALITEGKVTVNKKSDHRTRI